MVGNSTRPIDVLGNVFRDIADIHSILNNSNELKKMYVKTNFDDATEMQKLTKATKEMIDNLETKTSKIHIYFKKNYIIWEKDFVDPEVNGEAPVDKETQDEPESDKSAEINSTVDSTSIENGIDKSTSNDSDNVTTSTKTVDTVVNVQEPESNNATVDKEQSKSSSQPKGDSGLSEELNESKKCDEKDLSPQSKVFLKCVDISKLIKPDILPHFDAPKSASKKNDNTVFIILDSESEEDVLNASQRKRKNVSKSEPKKATRNTKKQDSSKNKRGSKGSRISTVEMISSDSDHLHLPSKTRLSRNAKKRKISYVNPSSSDISSLSDLDSDRDLRVSKTKPAQKSKRVFNPTKILDAQSDKKFSYKAYVRLERVPCEKLKENYLNEKENLEIKRLTNLKHLQKRHRSPTSTHENISLTKDSDTKSQRKGKRKHVSGIDHSDSDSLGHTSDVSIALDLEVAEGQKTTSPAPELCSSTEANVEEVTNEALEIVLDAINSELNDTNKSDDEETIQKADNAEETEKEQNTKDDEQITETDTQSNEKGNTSCPSEDLTNELNKTSEEKEQEVSAIDSEKNNESDKEKSNEKATPSSSTEVEGGNEMTSVEERKNPDSMEDKSNSDSDKEEETNEKETSEDEDGKKNSKEKTTDDNDGGKQEKSNEKETSGGESNSENGKETSKEKNAADDESGSEDDKEKKSREKKKRSTSTDDESSDDDKKKSKKKNAADDESSSEDDKEKKSREKRKRSTSTEVENSDDKNKSKKKNAANDESTSEDDKKKKSKEKKKRSSSTEVESSDDDKKKSKKKDKHSSSSENESSDDNRKRKSKRKDKHSDSSEVEYISDSSEKKKSKKKGKRSSSSEDDSESEKEKKSKGKSKSSEKSKWRRDQLLTSKLSETDSEEEFEKYKKRHEKNKLEAKNRYYKKKKVVITSDSDEKNEEYKPKNSSSSSSDSEKEELKEKESKKRRRIKRLKDSSEEEDGGNKSTRKTIRKVIAHESLAESTKRAAKEEKERKARILERQKKYNQIFDVPQDATLTKLVLDFDTESKKEILSVNEGIVKKLKPHQGKGVQFMWDTCYESVERAKKTEGSGCILAHCMGLGKTLQVIALTHTLLSNSEITDVKRVLVVCPLNTVLNWEAEYLKWLADVEDSEINLFELVSSKTNAREYLVDDWYRKGGVLIIGYDMFRNLTNPTTKRLKKRAKESFQRGLVNPGPDLVICDEGHLLKNEKTHISMAMNRIRTARRIVLTGTPMQNNLKEYYCMVQFVKPNLLGTYKEYINRFVNPITNGQYTDSTPHDINIMRKRSHVLHTMLDGIVQRKDYAVLTPYLPPKYEYILFLKLTPIQIKLYQHYKANFSQTPTEGKIKSTFLFKDFQEFQRICTHPQALLMKSREIQSKDISTDEDSEGSLKDFIDDKSEHSTSNSSSNESDSNASNSKSQSKKGKPEKRLTRTAAAASGIDVEQINDDVPQGWWSKYCNQDEMEQIELSSKLYFLFKILEECELAGEKLLVFSQSLLSLNVIEYFLAKIDEATQDGDTSETRSFSGSWTLGLDYFRLDGSSSCDHRINCCKRFNNVDNPRARLFLISTKAGGLGINLVGANRVVIFDVSWNPSHDTQSIYRVYRFGQTKPCYIYRFVIWGTMEMKIYERQVTKQAISKRVIDEQQIDRHYTQTDLAELYMFDPEPKDDIIPLVPKDILLGELLQKEKDRIYKYHEHQSLLENKEDEELNEAERKAAWEEFENEKVARVVNTNNIGWIRNLPVASINIALRNIIQRDNPEWTQEQILCVVPTIVQQLRAQVEAGKMTLFERVVNELRNIQVNQQTDFQMYIKRQQQLQQQQQQQQMSALQQHLRQQMFPNLNTNEIVELND